MGDNFFNIKNILGILFKVTKKNANILADRYLLKEVSIISKWKNNKADIKAEDISRIADFAVKESSEIQRKMIRKEIMSIINCSSVTDEIKEMIAGIKDFDEFIGESLNVCTSWSGDVSEINTNKAFDESNNRGKAEYKANTAKGIAGEYTGVVRFDLQLQKNKSDNHESTANKENIVFKNSKINLTPKNKSGNAKRFIEARTILSIILIAIVLGYTFILARNNNGNVLSGKSQNQSQQVQPEVKDSVPIKHENIPQKAEPAISSNLPKVKKSDAKETKKQQNEKKKPAHAGKSGSKTINGKEAKNNSENDEQNIDANINISDSSGVNVAAGKNIIINNNSGTAPTSPSQPKTGPSASSASSASVEDKEN